MEKPNIKNNIEHYKNKNLNENNSIFLEMSENENHSNIFKNINFNIKNSLEKYKTEKQDTKYNIFHFDLSDNLKYDIYLNNIKDIGGKVEFVLHKNEQKIANLIFTRTKSGLNMEHRLINSKNIGISGSLFLEKAEDFIENFIKNTNIKDDVLIYVNGPLQTQIVSWLEKNGFVFKEENNKKNYEEILKNDKWSQATIFLEGDKNEMEGFLVNREIKNDPIFKKKIEEKDNHFVINASWLEIKNNNNFFTGRMEKKIKTGKL